MQAISPCDEETGAVKDSSTFGAKLSGIKFFNVKLGTLWIGIDHALGSCTVATHQVFDAMYGLALKKIFYPGTTPTKEAVNRTLAMLFSLEVHGNLTCLRHG